MRSKFFRGADQNENKMSWVKWTKCLSSKQMGGLDIGVFMAKMEAFLMLPTVGLNNLRGAQFCLRSIVLRTKALISYPFVLRSLPMSTVLRRFPRGGAKMTQFDDLKAIIGSVSLMVQRDTWQWSLDVAGGFSVAYARAFVDDTMLEADFVATRWNRTIPIKVNVFLWRLHLNKLPSRVNLERRGVQIDSILCQTCQLDVETVNHIFFNCEMAKDLWSLLAKWWDLDIPICANISEWYDWLDVVRVAAMARSALEGVGGTIV
nr:hypothetical protein [Tanacetum cinerariifolium]